MPLSAQRPPSQCTSFADIGVRTSASLNAPPTFICTNAVRIAWARRTSSPSLLSLPAGVGAHCSSSDQHKIGQRLQMRSLHESHACTPNGVDRWNQPLGTKHPSTRTASQSESSVEETSLLLLLSPPCQREYRYSGPVRTVAANPHERDQGVHLALS
jgi:hypothetical protein